MTQQASLFVTDPTAARALRQDHTLLGLFVSPQSPSDLAPRLGMAPSLVHHHARRLTDLGLLFEQRREGGRVYFQLAAREFRVPSNLLPPEDTQGNGTADLHELSKGFLRAYGRSWAQLHDSEEDVYGFGDAEHPAAPMTPPDAPSPEGHPTHLDRLTLHLTPARYQRLARALSALLDEASAEGHSEGGQPCTLAVLAYREVPGPALSLSRSINSFLGAQQ
ncbi:hypothetical protein GO986_12990 [Deinococcus sp. HMF7620]|uniref:ArsR family transcriptional regulator n=1 Tax=Deinococcus arboris TaxID=2682977 RepID=A0A7C9LMX8_9DEIO|nr:winged helix-turn-helix domain-containing protein [Deinococcus arboris]MVN87677.1 hypothetical protein [Deinococcus arboris]